MLEGEILAACMADRGAYDRIYQHIQPTDFTPVGAYCWKVLGEWYKRDRAARHVDHAAFHAICASRIANSKQRAPVMDFLQELPEGVSTTNVAVAALELRRRNVGNEFAAATAKGDEKEQRKLLPILTELYQSTALGERSGVRWEYAVPAREVFKRVGKENRVPLAPSKLNRRVDGGALPGHHIVLYGRPESGKSTFSINFAVQLALRHNQRVLYIGNEDEINIIKGRAMARAAKMTHVEASENPDRVADIYEERGGEEHLAFVKFDGATASDLRGPIEEYGPTVLILDQIRNLEGSSDGLVQQLDYNGREVRRLLLSYGLIGLSVTQAGASAENQDWLGMDDIDSSKTGLPATADLLIGLGASPESKARGVRGLSFPKNKLSAAPDAHDSLTVEMDVALGRVA